MLQEVDIEVQTIISDIKGRDKIMKLRGLHNLRYVSSAIGPDNTRDLICQLMNDKSMTIEMHVFLAGTLGDMLAHIGGENEIDFLLSKLSHYCSDDSYEIHEKATDSFIFLASHVTTSVLSDILIPKLSEMSNSPFHRSRSSAATVMCQISNLCSTSSVPIIASLLEKLSQDSSVQVRKSLIDGIPFAINSNRYDQNIIKSIITTLSKDSEAIIVSSIPSSLIPFKTVYKCPNFVDYICQHITNCTFWQPKSSLINSIDKITQNPVIIEEIFRKAPNDSSQFVRSSFAKKIQYFLDNYGFNIQEAIDVYIKLSFDDSNDVKLSIAKSLSQSQPIIIEKVLPNLIYDSDSEIRYTSFHAFACVPSQLSLPIEYVCEVSRSSNWRNRNDSLIVIPRMISSVTDLEFSDKLLPIPLSLISDNVCEVRIRASECLKEISSKFGKEWCLTHIAPKIKLIVKDSDYHIRQVAIKSIFIMNLDDCFSSELKELSKDPVSNVRIIIAKEIPEIYQDIIRELQNDKDSDVSYFAKQRLNLTSL